MRLNVAQSGANIFSTSRHIQPQLAIKNMWRKMETLGSLNEFKFSAFSRLFIKKLWITVTKWQFPFFFFLNPSLIILKLFHLFS